MNPYIFTGSDEYLVTGEVYILALASTSDLSGGIVVSMWSHDRSLKFWSCPYQDWRHFLNNWRPA